MGTDMAAVIYNDIQRANPLQRKRSLAATVAAG
jgi:hypothetical protein